jgi:hypothetical protein
MSEKIETPRQARLALNKMEAWFRKNTAIYAPEDRVLLRALFEEAHTAEHAETLSKVLIAKQGDTSPESTNLTVTRQEVSRDEANSTNRYPR